jgi:hypothetical protein
MKLKINLLANIDIIYSIFRPHKIKRFFKAITFIENLIQKPLLNIQKSNFNGINEMLYISIAINCEYDCLTDETGNE